MSAVMPVFYMILLLGLLLLGLVLLAVGIVLLLRLKNKLAGALITAVGVVLTLFPPAVFFALVTITRFQS